MKHKSLEGEKMLEPTIQRMSCETNGLNDKSKISFRAQDSFASCILKAKSSYLIPQASIKLQAPDSSN